MDYFKTTLLTLKYRNNSIYADNWKNVIYDLVNASMNEEIPKDWMFGLSQIQTGIMHTVCDKCNDVPLFKWLHDLYNSFKNGTDHPEMPSCRNCYETYDSEN